MVILSDTLSSIINKGEITPRYYNPGELFREVHIVITKDDEVNPKDVQEMVGRAELFIHNVPLDDHAFLRTLGLRPWLLNRWAEKGVRLARAIGPDLIRCYENYFNGFMAARIKQKLDIPIVISFHDVPERYLQGEHFRATSLRERLVAWCLRGVRKPAFRNADHFIAVYKSIVPYLEKTGTRHYSVIYNAVGFDASPKSVYELHSPPRCICVARQDNHLKDPTHIVEAIAELADVQLVLIGRGDLHDRIVELAKRLKCADRCKFIPALENEQVLEALHDSDIFVFNQLTGGISKSIIEAALTGLPIIVNRTPGKDELDGDWFVQVEDSKEDYMKELKRLLENKPERERIGRRAYAHARAHWVPEQMEAMVADIYKRLMHDPSVKEIRN